MTNLMNVISDEAKLQRAAELAAQPGWNQDLAAVAVLSGSAGAVDVINNALKLAAGASGGPTDGKAKAEIALLQQKIVEAKQRKDPKQLVALKTLLYDRYKIGST